jgi:Sec7-like guanine-nucleotide exchange factor
MFACNKKSFSQKHDNIFSNVQFVIHVSVTSNHYQADISVHGHDMFSASENALVKFYVCVTVRR